MNRRAFVTGLGAVLAAPLGVGAQQAAKISRIGYLGTNRTPHFQEAFRQGLRDLGARREVAPISTGPSRR